MSLPVGHSLPLFETLLTRSVDKAETFEGMPTHVQVMGRPMQDEELLKILKVVEDTLAEYI
jgi:Asp-tRNA(Asn)/Glu-tRNA(Gln) amidotransferase A subunit family amidase